MSRIFRAVTSGFTLVELMIVIAVIGILAAIAVPGYLAWVCRSRVGEGTTAMEAIRQGAEGYRINPRMQMLAICGGAETHNHVGSDSNWGCLGFGPDAFRPGRRYTCVYGALAKVADLNNDAALTAPLLNCQGQVAKTAAKIGGLGYIINACGNMDNDTTIDAGFAEFPNTSSPLGRDCMD